LQYLTLIQDLHALRLTPRNATIGTAIISIMVHDGTLPRYPQ
jgi:hypothetical protein